MINRTYLIFTYGLVILLSSSEAFASASPREQKHCEPPPESEWHFSIETLAIKTRHIVVAKLVSKRKSGHPPDLKPDFIPKGGLAVHGRRGSDGTRKSQHADLWNSISWTFEVIEPLKGKMEIGKKFSFVTLDVVPGVLEELTQPLCDLPLHFAMEREYVIFVKSYNPKGYSLLTQGNRKFVEEIKSIVQRTK